MKDERVNLNRKARENAFQTVFFESGNTVLDGVFVLHGVARLAHPEFRLRDGGQA
jgi:hypothetical protein